MGMVKAIEELKQTGSWTSMSNDECIGLIADRELSERLHRRTTARIRKAKLRIAAMIEDINWQVPRGLDRGVMNNLATCEWIRRKQNVIFNGPTGTGKTWLACALADKACREGFTTRFVRFPRLFTELAQARLDGSTVKYMKELAKVDLLVLDDWGQTLGETDRRELFEIIEDRNEKSSLIITSQLPVDHWHEAIGDPTIADAILDRIVHRAHKVVISGRSLRGEQILRDESDKAEKKTPSRKGS